MLQSMGVEKEVQLTANVNGTALERGHVVSIEEGVMGYLYPQRRFVIFGFFEHWARARR